MTHHLYVTASVRTEGSKSSELSQFFRNALAAKDLQATFTARDVGITPPPHPTHAYTVANYTPPDERTPDMAETLQTSDLLIDEILAADTLIIAVRCTAKGVRSRNSTCKHPGCKRFTGSWV